MSHLIINQNTVNLCTAAQAKRFWLENYLCSESTIMQHSYAAAENRMVPFKYSGRCFDNEIEAITYLKENLSQDVAGGCYFMAAKEPTVSFFVHDEKSRDMVNTAKDIKKQEMELLTQEIEKSLKKDFIACPECKSKFATSIWFKDYLDRIMMTLRYSCAILKRAEYGLLQDCTNPFEQDIEGCTLFDCPICHKEYALLSSKALEKMRALNAEHNANVANIFSRCAAIKIKTFKIYADFLVR